MTGKVSNVPPEKRFGFISGEDGLEYFFHETDVADHSFNVIATKFKKEGGGKVGVTFDTLRTDKGPRAANVTLSI